jgi:subtilisin family serine protease
LSKACKAAGIERLARLLALIGLALGLAGTATRADDLCWQGCAALMAQDPGLLRSRIATSPGGQAESILVGPPSDLAAMRAAVAAVGGLILREVDRPALGLVSVIAVFPGLAAYERALARLVRTAPDTGMSANWTYDFAQTLAGMPAAAAPAGAPRLYAPQLIGDERPGRCRLAAPVRIGMIDGPVNPAHPALRGARLRHEVLTGPAPVPVADHGTAVAVLMVGEDPSGILAGYARGAELIAVSVFTREGAATGTTVERIVAALDLLVGRQARLINMSFSGPRSPALGVALNAGARRGVVMVGASGNDGVAQVAYPAEAPEVIAVTAVDAARRRYRLANTGGEVEIAAPGVDVYLAQAQGGGYGSGTSFAAPVVTALLAREMARGATGSQALRNHLRGTAEALGRGGRSAEFGWGLARAGAC